jgi:hypothetical protein
MLLDVHLCIGVQWNPRLPYNTLPSYLVYPYESKSHDSITMLSNMNVTHYIRQCHVIDKHILYVGTDKYMELHSSVIYSSINQ